jgi:hypothetical protein
VPHAFVPNAQNTHTVAAACPALHQTSHAKPESCVRAFHSSKDLLEK